MYEGGLKIWECSEDLVRYLHAEYHTKLGKQLPGVINNNNQLKIILDAVCAHVQYFDRLCIKVEAECWSWGVELVCQGSTASSEGPQVGTTAFLLELKLTSDNFQSGSTTTTRMYWRR